jgi:hypothetical protein
LEAKTYKHRVAIFFTSPSSIGAPHMKHLNRDHDDHHSGDASNPCSDQATPCRSRGWVVGVRAVLRARTRSLRSSTRQQAARDGEDQRAIGACVPLHALRCSRHYDSIIYCASQPQHTPPDETICGATVFAERYVNQASNCCIVSAQAGSQPAFSGGPSHKQVLRYKTPSPR